MLKRAKRRYLALEIDSAETFDSKEFLDAVWNNIAKLYGECGASRTSMTMIDYRMEERFAVIRVANAATDIARTALASITKIGNKPVAIHVLTVSGTLKALYKNAKRQR